jgi:iron complex outermembrane receptor protein
MKRFKSTKAILVCAASVAAITVAAQAQQAPENVEQVVVTGSRVISDIANSPTPVTIVSSDQIAATTPTNLSDGLNKLPVFMGSSSPRSISNSDHNGSGNVLNLRDFGAQRTLVLVDGHRVPASNADGTVDTDVLPQMLVSRVDVVTGGASAVYGSDAVTGVVNFVLDKNFDGVKYNGSAGISKYGDAAEEQLGAAAGTDLFGGRGHWEGSARYFHQDMVRMDARPYAYGGQAYLLTGAGTSANPYTTTPYSRQTVQGESAHIISCGGCAANNMQFVQDGIIGPYNSGAPTGTGGISTGGDGAYDSDASFQSSLRTAELFNRFSYNINDTTTAYINLTAAEAKNFTNWDEFNLNPSTTRPNTFFVNNPYVPATAQALLANPSGKFSIAGRIATYIGGQKAADQGLTYDSVSNDRNLNMTAGVQGTLLDKYDWEVFYTHGESRQKELQPNNTNNQKLYAAMDAVLDSSGNPVCYVSTTSYANLYPGCVPISPFGPDGMTVQQYRYISEPTYYIMTNTLDDLGASISGDVLNLPAGPVKAALSGEMRWAEYDVVSNISPTGTVNCTGLRLCNSATSLYVQSASGAIHASDNVWEFAGEANLPIVKDLPLVQSLSADLAGRYTNYSISGSVETWKIGLDYHVNDDIRFRGTASVDIRAPNLNDLFAPLKATNSGFNDLLTHQTFSVPQHTQGNPSLVPEVAHTWTGGVVLTPTFIPGLTMSVDYYRIAMSGAITSISYSSLPIQQLCISSGGASPYCALVNRPYPITNTSTANFPNYFVTEELNSANVKTEGVDVEVDYGFDMADVMPGIPGSVNLRELLSLQPYISTVNYPGAPEMLTSMPKGRLTGFLNYQIGSWGISLQDTYFDSFSKVTQPGQVYVQPYVSSFNTLDVTLDKKFQVAGGDVDLYFSVQNVFNAQAPLDPTNTSTPGNSNPVNAYENDMGRYFTIGLKGDL